MSSCLEQPALLAAIMPQGHVKKMTPKHSQHGSCCANARDNSQCTMLPAGRVSCPAHLANITDAVQTNATNQGSWAAPIGQYDPLPSASTLAQDSTHMETPKNASKLLAVCRDKPTLRPCSHAFAQHRHYTHIHTACPATAGQRNAAINACLQFPLAHQYVHQYAPRPDEPPATLAPVHPLAASPLMTAEGELSEL